jgi:hypothetical protein
MGLTCFTDFGLHSKRQWLLPDKFVEYASYLVPFFLLLIIIQLVARLKQVNLLLSLGLIFVAFYIADLLSGIGHLVYIDGSYEDTKYKMEGGRMVIPTNSGYASCHHVFPSNWKDVSDRTLITTIMFPSVVPIVASAFMRPAWSLLTICITVFIMLAPFSHKYSHEKLHKRHVPPAFNFLYEIGIFLNPKHHRKHHIENKYNWALFNGVSDPLLNCVVRNLCNTTRVCPNEVSIFNAKRFRDEVRLRFVGDIEGDFTGHLKDNVFVA